MPDLYDLYPPPVINPPFPTPETNPPILAYYGVPEIAPPKSTAEIINDFLVKYKKVIFAFTGALLVLSLVKRK